MLSALALCAHLLTLKVAKSCAQIDVSWAEFTTADPQTIGLLFHDGRPEIFQQVERPLLADALGADYPVYEGYWSHVIIVTNKPIAALETFKVLIEDACEYYSSWIDMQHDDTVSEEVLKNETAAFKKSTADYKKFVGRTFNLEVCK